MTRRYTPDALPPLISEADWTDAAPHDGSDDRPDGVAPSDIVILAWGMTTPLAWAYAARRAAPAHEHAWRGAVAYRVRIQSIGAKVSHVREEIAADTGAHRHHCHWPGCDEDVPPATWGCKRHWYMLPKSHRDRIWATYRPGQEVTKTPSREYVGVAREVQRWIEENYPPEQTLFGHMKEKQT